MVPGILAHLRSARVILLDAISLCRRRSEGSRELALRWPTWWTFPTGGALATSGVARRPPPEYRRRLGGPLLDHLIRPLQERRRDREAEGLGGLEVDDQLELCGLLDGQVGRFGAVEDSVHIGGGSTRLIG